MSAEEKKSKRARKRKQKRPRVSGPWGTLSYSELFDLLRHALLDIPVKCVLEYCTDWKLRQAWQNWTQCNFRMDLEESCSDKLLSRLGIGPFTRVHDFDWMWWHDKKHPGLADFVETLAGLLPNPRIQLVRFRYIDRGVHDWSVLFRLVARAFPNLHGLAMAQNWSLEGSAEFLAALKQHLSSLPNFKYLLVFDHQTDVLFPINKHKWSAALPDHALVIVQTWKRNRDSGENEPRTQYVYRSRLWNQPTTRVHYASAVCESDGDDGDTGADEDEPPRKL